MTDLTREVALSHAEAPHQTGASRKLQTLEAAGHEFHGNQWTKCGTARQDKPGIKWNELVVKPAVKTEDAKRFQALVDRMDPHELPVGKITLQLEPVVPTRPTAYGFYKKRTNEILVRAGMEKMPEAVLLHEAGHAMDENLGIFQKAYQAYDADENDRREAEWKSFEPVRDTGFKQIAYYAHSEVEAVAQAVSIHLGKKYEVPIPNAYDFVRAFPKLMTAVGTALDANDKFMKDRKKEWK